MTYHIKNKIYSMCFKTLAYHIYYIFYKSRQGITIRKNKQPVSIGQSSNSHVNRTDSAHSINARLASNMIPCFSANNSTDVHHCDIVSSRSSPSHFTKDTPLNISQVRTRSITYGKMLMLQFITGRLIRF